MTTISARPAVTAQQIKEGWYSEDACLLADFERLVNQQTDIADFEHADEVVSNVLVYGDRLPQHLDDPTKRREVQTEIARALLSGPGIVMFRGAFADDVIDRATAAFERMIEQQKRSGGSVGDHFAAAGTNDRVWNALEKLAVAEPDIFTAYYANDVLALASQAWLGPNYQVTSQLNVVNPGGRAQTSHRDYHLGIQTAVSYPSHVHAMSTLLTLQGAIAHVDMPVETGPTMYLPYSQQYDAGFVAVHRSDFARYFESHYVQLPLRKGDAVFFNPGLFHGAGTNLTVDVARMANLLQVSSAFGRAMEAVDTTAICKAIYFSLRQQKVNRAPQRALENVMATAAEGYPFPTNLDRDQPKDTLAPPSQLDVLTDALDQDWPSERLFAALDAQQERRRTDRH